MTTPIKGLPPAHVKLIHVDLGALGLIAKEVAEYFSTFEESTTGYRRKRRYTPVVSVYLHAESATLTVPLNFTHRLRGPTVRLGSFRKLKSGTVSVSGRLLLDAFDEWYEAFNSHGVKIAPVKSPKGKAT